MCAGACVVQSTDKADKIKLDCSVDTPVGKKLKSFHETTSVVLYSALRPPTEKGQWTRWSRCRAEPQKKDPSPGVPLL